MIAFYTGQAGFGMPAAATRLPTRRASQLTRVEARQKVLITSKDGQTATGDWAIFDVKANTVLLVDHVVVSRGKDVAEGPRLKIDLTTGMYRFELETGARRGPGGPATSAVAAAHGPGPRLSQRRRPGAPVRPASSACWSIRRRPRTGQGRDREGAARRSCRQKAGDGWQPSTSASPAQRGD